MWVGQERPAPGQEPEPVRREPLQEPRKNPQALAHRP
jgi:hypothetical protein